MLYKYHYELEEPPEHQNTLKYDTIDFEAVDDIKHTRGVCDIINNQENIVCNVSLSAFEKFFFQYAKTSKRYAKRRKLNLELETLKKRDLGT